MNWCTTAVKEVPIHYIRLLHMNWCTTAVKEVPTNEDKHLPYTPEQT